MQMQQPLTAKELEYIVDSMSNEELQIKQSAVAAATSQNPTIHNVCIEMLNSHQQHYQTLLNSLQQHVNLAPNYPQQ